VDHFLANSTFVAERIRRYYGREAEVLHPPVDVEAFAPRRDEDREEDRDEEFALVLAALAPYKRIDRAIEACERLGLELRIVGSGPEASRLERLAGERTRFLGRVAESELTSLLRRARLFLQPGVEDFGIAAVEALAAGTPVVARGRGGILDIVEQGRHGVLYSGDDADSLVEAIDKARHMRFNKLELTQRACAFSKARFHERLCEILSRWSPASEGRSDDPEATS
jgi:glycosyltransferase involved in cell wall biosynthesis